MVQLSDKRGICLRQNIVDKWNGRGLKVKALQQGNESHKVSRARGQYGTLLMVTLSVQEIKVTSLLNIIEDK